MLKYNHMSWYKVSMADEVLSRIQNQPATFAHRLDSNGHHIGYNYKITQKIS